MKLYQHSIKMMEAKGATAKNNSWILSQDYATDFWACSIKLKVDAGVPTYLIHSASEQSVVQINTRQGHNIVKNWPASWETIEALCGDANDGIDEPCIIKVLRRG